VETIMKLNTLLILASVLAGSATGQTDDFAREGGSREAKDRLEGQAPPPLQVTNWLNTEAPIKLAGLRGKVVLLDFWGTW
jgi:hypothetical protein